MMMMGVVGGEIGGMSVSRRKMDEQGLSASGKLCGIRG